MQDKFGSEHTINGYAFPAEVITKKYFIIVQKSYIRSFWFHVFSSDEEEKIKRITPRVDDARKKVERVHASQHVSSPFEY